MDVRQTSDISSGPPKTLNKAAFYGIIAHHNHNRNRRGRVLRKRSLFPSKGEDDVWLETHQIVGSFL